LVVKYARRMVAWRLCPHPTGYPQGKALHLQIELAGAHGSLACEGGLDDWSM
jgi:hypothetical protein